MGLKQHLRLEIKGWKKFKSQSELVKYKEWILNEGTLFTKVNIFLSQQLAKEYNCKIKSCYKNVWDIASIQSDFKFFEGYIWNKRIPMPMEHAFLVRDGAVIDPTLAISDNDVILQMRAKKMSKRFIKVMNRQPKTLSEKMGEQYIGFELPLEFVNEQYLKHKIHRL